MVGITSRSIARKSREQMEKLEQRLGADWETDGMKMKSTLTKKVNGQNVRRGTTSVMTTSTNSSKSGVTNIRISLH
jgi:hypothetical protein